MERQNFGKALREAKAGGYAVGAFNIVNYLSTDAAVKAAEKLDSPIILQTSVSTVNQIGPKELIGMINIARASANVPVIVHLDHCTDPFLAVKCMDCGWDSIMIDASARPFEENIKITSEIVKIAHDRGICVEGELGIIGGVEDNVAADESRRAGFEESMEYVERTGIDAFAPSIGTAHGVYKTAVRLNYELVGRLKECSDVPVVVHGGTGLSDDQFRKLIKEGAAKINISTAIKYGYIDGYKNYFSEKPDEYNPLKLDKFVTESIADVVIRHIRLFGSEGRAANA